MTKKILSIESKVTKIIERGLRFTRLDDIYYSVILTNNDTLHSIIVRL